MNTNMNAFPQRDTKNRFSGLVRPVLGLALCIADPVTSAEAQSGRVPIAGESLSSLPLGALNDQFGRSLDVAALRGRAVILLVADKDGSDGQRLWLSALRTSVPSMIAVVAAADLVGAPRLLRGVIRSGFPKDTTARILMDWDGKVARRIRGERDHLVGVVFGADGALRERVVLPVSSVTAEMRARLLSVGGGDR
jgi:hypothetical protein